MEQLVEGDLFDPCLFVEDPEPEMPVVQVAHTVLVSPVVLLHLVALDVGSLDAFLEGQLVSHQIELPDLAQPVISLGDSYHSSRIVTQHNLHHWRNCAYSVGLDQLVQH